MGQSDQYGNAVFHSREKGGLCNTLLTFSQCVHIQKKKEVAWLCYLSHGLSNVLLGNPRFCLGYISRAFMGLQGELVQVTCAKQTAGFVPDARISLTLSFVSEFKNICKCR